MKRHLINKVQKKKGREMVGVSPASDISGKRSMVPSWHAESCPGGCLDGMRGVSRSVSSVHVCGVSPAVGQLPVWCLVGTRGVPGWTPRGRLAGVSPVVGSCPFGLVGTRGVPGWTPRGRLAGVSPVVGSCPFEA